MTDCTEKIANLPIAALLLFASAQISAQPATYGFSTAPGPIPGSEPTLSGLLHDLSVSGSFIYDPDAAEFGTIGPGQILSGSTIFTAAIEITAGTIGSWSFSDPGGPAIVGDDRFTLPVPTPPPPADFLQLAADPAIASGAPPEVFDLAGFSLGAYQLVNVRLFWLEGQLGIGDFLADQMLPQELPAFAGRLALDFIVDADPTNEVRVFFDDLIVVPAPVISEVGIDIKPGSDPNCFNINGLGVIPVAVLGSGTFDVSQIDPASLLFGGLSVRVRGNRGPICTYEYANPDDFLDAVCQFEDDADNWQAGSDSASVTGTTFAGEQFSGTDSICIVPAD